MAKKTKFILTLLIVFGIAALSLSTSFFGETVSAKAKYKTYKNTTYGFSVEYPVTWRVRVVTFDEGLNFLFDYGKELVSNPDLSTAPSAGIRKTSNNLEQEVQATVEMIKANIFGLRDIKLKIKNTKVAKIKAKQINHLNSFIYDRDMELVTVMFVKDNLLWSMGGPAKDPGVKHFISSFKFIPKK